MIVPRAKANQQIAEAKLIYEDETKSIKERIAALRKSLELEIETTDNEIKHQGDVIANLIKINAEKKKNGQLTDEDDQKLQEAYAKQIELQTESDIKQRKLQSTLNNAQKELIKGLGTINQLNKRKLEIDQELASLDLTSKLGREKHADLLIEKQRVEGLIEAYGKLGELKTMTGRFKNVQVKATKSEAIPAVVPVQVEFTAKDIRSSWKKFLDNIGLSEGELTDMGQRISQSLTDLLGNLNQIQLDAAEKEVKIRDEKLSDLKAKLKDEKEARDEGRANEYDAILQSIAETEKLRDEANKKLEKAQKREALIQLAAQASDIITATANIIEGWTEINPIAGALLGIAQAGAMVAAFVGYKAKINAISKYAEGEVDIDGKPHSQGGKIVEIEGGESVIRKKATAKSKRLLEAVNEGKLSDIDLYRLNFGADLGRSNYQRYDSTSEMLKELQESNRTNAEILEFMKSQSHYERLNNGDILEIKGNSMKRHHLE
jgi:hypothetical protein